MKTFKRDYVSVNPVPDAQTVIDHLPVSFEHYNRFHPHKALGYRSPKEFLADKTRRKPPVKAAGQAA
ncbi:UNVERIFIED_ORG: transposase InsO family protein [Rhizobium esperanzae]